MEATMALDQASGITSPAIKKLVECAVAAKRDKDGNAIERMSYDKWTYEKTSTCLCVLGGM